MTAPDPDPNPFSPPHAPTGSDAPTAAAPRPTPLPPPAPLPSPSPSPSPYEAAAPHPGAAPREPSTGSGWVIAAFLLFWPLGIPALLASQRAARALGAQDLQTTRRESERARSWGVGAVIVGAVAYVGSWVTVVVLLASGIFAVSTFSETATTSVIDLGAPGSTTPDGSGVDSAPEALDTDILDLAVGDCVSTTDLPDTVFTVPVVPCASDHQAEVYAITHLAAGDFPGDEGVQALAEDFCFEAFESYVGLPYEDSELYAWWFSPTEENWTWGDRSVQCFLEPLSGTVTGTLEGAAR
ncbi:septum formation family protein [Cellulosimicrobium sp. NPDC057127]|uniref:septum formation family protein n=1 Tax=Cellulosimicrobium sp. NPDC057127 TaxID=3346026 RepID=UPI00362C1627